VRRKEYISSYTPRPTKSASNDIPLGIPRLPSNLGIPRQDVDMEDRDKTRKSHIMDIPFVAGLGSSLPLILVALRVRPEGESVTDNILSVTLNYIYIFISVSAASYIYLGTFYCLFMCICSTYSMELSRRG